jgi:hypothetical protein
VATYVFDQKISGSLLSDVDAKVAIVGLDNVHVDTTVGGRLDTSADVTLSSDSKVATSASLEVAPLTTASSVDLAPVAVDTCIRVELGSLPATELSTPWEQRLGLSILGVELFAWVLCGESTTTVRPAQREPFIAGSVESHGRGCSCGCHGHDDRDGQEPGLEIRLGH